MNTHISIQLLDFCLPQHPHRFQRLHRPYILRTGTVSALKNLRRWVWQNPQNLKHDVYTHLNCDLAPDNFRDYFDPSSSLFVEIVHKC